MCMHGCNVLFWMRLLSNCRLVPSILKSDWYQMFWCACLLARVSLRRMSCHSTRQYFTTLALEMKPGDLKMHTKAYAHQTSINFYFMKSSCSTEHLTAKVIWTLLSNERKINDSKKVVIMVSLEYACDRCVFEIEFSNRDPSTGQHGGITCCWIHNRGSAHLWRNVITARLLIKKEREREGEITTCFFS